MNKRHWHHLWTKFRAVKPWYFLALALLSGLVCLLALRANNQHMIDLRNAVYTADKNNGDVQGALHNLQTYVTSHMNTDLSSGPNSVYPPIQLKYTYDRLVQAQGDQLAQANSQLYTDAQHYCEAQNPTGFYGATRIGCVEQYLTSHGEININLAPIPDALYKFDFVSPTWSPDLAGWSLVLTFMSLLLFVVSFVFAKLARSNL